jgi:PAS domain S-box-containing protein
MKNMSDQFPRPPEPPQKSLRPAQTVEANAGDHTQAKELTPEEMQKQIASLKETVAAQQRQIEQLLQSEAMWRSVVANAAIYILILDRDGRIQFINHTPEGIGFEDAIGNSIYNFIRRDYHAEFRKQLEAVFETGESQFFELIGTGPNGQESWYETYLGPVKLGEQIVAVNSTTIDITNRKQTQLALQDAKNSADRDRLMLQAAVDSLPFDFFGLDVHNRYILQNRISKSYWGDVLGKSPEEISSNENDLAIWRENNRRAMSGQWVEADVTMHYQGEERLYHNVVVPIRSGEEIYGILGVNIDITDQRRAEESLRLSEENLKKAHDELERLVEERTAELFKANKELAIHRLFADTATQGFGIADLDGRVRYLNLALCRIMGENRVEDVHGRFFFDYGPSQQFMKEEYLPALLKAGQLDREGMLTTRQGTTVPIWSNSFIIRDDAGQPAFIAAIISDITERKKAQETLQQSLDELKTLYEGMSDGLVITDLETKQILRSNPAFRQMLGYTEEEARSLTVKDIHPAEEVPVVIKRFEQRLAGRKIPFVTSTLLRKDGVVIPVEVTSNTFTFAGRPCVTGFFRDVTERIRAQEALQREHRTLKHLLQSSDHERQTIAYEIHDGLAQYLAGAIMQIQTFYHHKDANPELAKKSYAAGMTMLEQSHAEARRLISGVRPPVLDEAGVVEAIAHLINEQNRDVGPKLEFHSIVRFSRLSPILENAIYRIIQEGMNNACKYSHSKRARITLFQQHDLLRIEIRDWGCGFDPKEIQEGSYGLAGIRERARLLGGKYRLQTAADKGTRIVVILPLMESEK